jgi:hypothetical protein
MVDSGVKDDSVAVSGKVKVGLTVDLDRARAPALTLDESVQLWNLASSDVAVQG